MNIFCFQRMFGVMKIGYVKLAVSGVCFAALSAFCYPSNSKAVETVNDDGSVLTLKKFGDEHFHYATTEDGYLVVGSHGSFRFAADDGTPSEFVAKNPRFRNASEGRFLKGVSKSASLAAHKRKFVDRYPETNRNERWLGHNFSVNFVDSGAAPLVRFRPTGESFVKGERYFPVLLVTMSDIAGGDSTKYARYLNESGYKDDGNFGSLRDYYLTSSNGVFSPHFDVYPVTLPGSFGSYDEGSMTSAAIDILVNRADYKANAGKYENPAAFIFLYPGDETSALRYNEGYWGHQYWMQYNGAGQYGKGYCKSNYCFDKYLFIAQKADGSSKVNTLGIFAHEFSHVMGLADHYGYEYTNESKGEINSNVFVEGPAPYDVMTQGMYNGNGNYPPTFSAFERETMGWITETELASGQVLSLPALNSEPVAYAATNPNHNDEYYVLEYRPSLGFDSKIGKNGVFVWYVDYDKKFFYDYNNPNGNLNHPRITVKQVLNSNGSSFANFAFVNAGGVAKVSGAYSLVLEGNNRVCFATDVNNGISACPADVVESSSSSVPASSSAEAISSSSSVEISSSAVVSSSSANVPVYSSAMVARSSSAVVGVSSSSTRGRRSSSSWGGWIGSSSGSIVDSSSSGEVMRIGSNVLDINVGTPGIRTIQIFDLHGNLLMEEVSSEVESRIMLARFGKGVRIVRIVDEGGLQMVRPVVVK